MMLSALPPARMVRAALFVGGAVARYGQEFLSDYVIDVDKAMQQQRS